MENHPRIASLLPSATEMVCALGLRDHLVGVSHECDWPAEVKGLPVLTSARVSAGTSRAIDRDVRRLVSDALAVYEIDIEGLRRARPDIVVTQDLCEVCAVSFDDVCAAARELANPELQIVNLHPLRLADIWDDLRRVASACGREDAAATLIATATRTIETIRDEATALPRPSTLTIEWIEPVMVGGLWMPELIELAGGRCLVTRAGELAPTLTPEDLANLDPDVVLIKPCGFPIARTLEEAPTLGSLFRSLEWPALRNGDVFVADGNAFFNRPGPRIVDSLEILAACLHPATFPALADTHAGHCRRWPANP